MSFQQKKKIIDKLILDENIELELAEDQQIVVYLGAAGVNIHRVIPLEFCPDLQIDSISESCTETFLVSMPKKYRGLQYLKKCDLLITDKIMEGKKVLGEINCIVSKDHILSLYRQKLWPAQEYFEQLSIKSPDAVIEWASKFGNAFATPSVPPKNRRKCEIQEDFVSSEEESEDESEDDEEAEDCDYEDCQVVDPNGLISAIRKPSGVVTNK